MATHTFGRIGVWAVTLRPTEQVSADEVGEAAAELESLGYGTLWLGGSPAVDDTTPLLAATSTITVATGILSVWEHPASFVADRTASLNAKYGNRFVLGLGVSHDKITENYAKPYSKMRQYLTDLDAAATPVPASGRVLAALGPKMLELSRDQAAGAHPYLVTAEYVHHAREVLGTGPVLAPELKVVLDEDLTRARATAREYLSFYLELPNYTNNFLRAGFTEDDLRDGGSDRLLDGVFALGGAERVRARADEFLAAGADHLAIQVVTPKVHTVLPREELRALAEVLPTGA